MIKPKIGYKFEKWYFGKQIEIPTEWEISSIGKIGKYVNGLAFKPSDWRKNGIPIIRIQNLTNESQSFNYCDKPFEKIYEINKGDILISWSASIGVFRWNRLTGVLNQHIFKAIPNRNVDNVFYYFAVESSLQDMKKMIHGSTMQHITKKPFLDTIIPLPPFLEQQKIGIILSNLDNTIQKTNQIIEQILLLKKGLMQKLLTKGIGHKKFKKVKWFFGKEIEMPEKWDILKGSDACSEIVVGIVIKPASLYSKEGLPYLRSFNIKEDRINEKDIALISKKSNELNSKSKLKNGDVLIIRTGYPGTSCVVPKKFIGGNCVDLVIARPKNFLNSFFLSRFINSDVGKAQVLKSKNGIAQQHFNVGEMKNMLIPIPPIFEQQKIISILSNVDLQIQTEELYKSNLEFLKKGLMQKLLTGKIRVKFTK